MLTRGVCRAIPNFLAIALAEVTTPLATRPGPPSFSLAKMKIVSPLAMCLPPYIVFCSLNTNVSDLGSRTSALIANIMPLIEPHRFHDRPWRAERRRGCSECCDQEWTEFQHDSHGPFDRLEQRVRR